MPWSWIGTAHERAGTSTCAFHIGRLVELVDSVQGATFFVSPCETHQTLKDLEHGRPSDRRICTSDRPHHIFVRHMYDRFQHVENCYVFWLLVTVLLVRYVLMSPCGGPTILHSGKRQFLSARPQASAPTPCARHNFTQWCSTPA